jgi:two-component system sensor histidine kinase/response regulator
MLPSTPHLGVRMTHDLIATLREKDALYQVTSAIIERVNLADLLQTVVNSVARALPAERVVLITFDLNAREVIHFVKGGAGAGSVVLVPFEELLHGLSGWVLREHLPALSLKFPPDPRELPDVQQRRAETNCGDIIVVPMRYHGTTLGTLTAISRFDGEAFGQSQLDIMMAMAGHAAVAITTAEYDAQLLSEIQERKRLEVSLALARDQALDASRLKSEFLANMSHEIRTPMNAILGLLKLLQNTDLNPRQRDYASKSHGAAQFLLGLLNDILDFSKVEAGKMTLDKQPMRLDQVLRNLSVVLSANVGARDIEVLFDVDGALPEVVLGDAMRLQQVLVNLGGNAVKFTSKGQVVLALRKVNAQALEGQPETVTIGFSVSDSGIGIAAEQHDRIFSGFSQAEGSTTRRFGGTGLGLAISQRMVEVMGGRIRVSSTLGVGSIFSFDIAFPVVSDVPLELLVPARPVVGPERVLVVDDSTLAGDLTVRMVKSWGWEAALVHSGQQALDLIRDALDKHSDAFPYPVIYMDWQMPDMDGWEAARQIRQMAQVAQRAQPTIIMVTGQGRDTLAQRSEIEQNLLNGFLVKPVTASMLMDAYMGAKAGTPGVRHAARSLSSQRQLNGMRILVVEDNLINQQVAEELLVVEGAIVSLAANGQLGVEAVVAAAPQFDVVLMDIQMPVLDGYGATQMLRYQLGYRDLPIVAMTANAMASDRAACLAAGMNEHVGKPFDMDQLVSLLIRVTGIVPESAALAQGSHLSVQSLTVPEVAGLDLSVALSRMSGMRALYVRTARDFTHTLDTTAEELRLLLANRDARGVLMRLHTLKGNAATLGAMSLAQHAGAMETLCQAGGEVIAYEADMERLAVLIEQAQSSLKQAVAQLEPTKQAVSATHAGVLDKTFALAALRELAALSEASDLDVMQRYAELQTQLAGLPTIFSDQMEKALQGLDLDTVHTLCKAQIAQLTG